MNVKVIYSERKAVLVEYIDDDGNKQRCIIPEESLENGNTVRDELLSASIPYGVDWEFHLEGAIGKITPGMIAEEFHKANLWTAEDVLYNPKKVEGILRRVYGLDYAGVINIAKNLIKK